MKQLKLLSSRDIPPCEVSILSLSRFPSTIAQNGDLKHFSELSMVKRSFDSAGPKRKNKNFLIKNGFRMQRR